MKNKSHNKVNNFFSKLVILFAFLLVTNMFSQRIVDTNEKFEYYVESGKGANDCTVRALSIVKNVSYPKAYSILKNLGRQDNEGFDIRLLLQYLNNTKMFKGMTDNILEKKVTARMLINKDVLDKESNYLVFADSHIFAIRYDGKRFITYGNYNDLDTHIISLIAVNKTK